MGPLWMLSDENKDTLCPLGEGKTKAQNDSHWPAPTGVTWDPDS